MSEQLDMGEEESYWKGSTSPRPSSEEGELFAAHLRIWRVGLKRKNFVLPPIALAKHGRILR